jgi:hypothetical protein
MSVIETSNDDTKSVNKENTVTVIGGDVKQIRVCGAVQLADVHKYARESGISRFQVFSPRTSLRDARGLDTGDFPFDGNIVIQEHNEAKTV